MEYRVRLQKDKVRQYNFKGLGVQWDPYVVHPVTEDEWENITRRVDFLKPTFVRLMIYAPSYCKGIDENNNPIYDFECEAVKALLQELDYLNEHNIEVVLGEWEAPYRFGDSFKGVTTENYLWAKIIVGLLNFLVKEKEYKCIKYFNYVNEANAEWSLCADVEKWKKGILYLYEELVKNDLSDKVKITGPDSVWDEDDSWLRFIAKDKELDDKIGLYDVHMYPTIEQIKACEVEKHVSLQRSIVSGKDFYMTEVGMVTGKYDGDSQLYIRDYSYGVAMSDIVCQVVNGGLSGLSIWDLDDAFHTQENGYPKSDIRSLKQWGFFNSVAGRVFNRPEDEALRPHFYTWSLMTRCFGRGCNILEITPQKNDNKEKYTDLRVLGMHKAEDSSEDFSIMFVNHGKKDIDVALELNGILNTSKDLMQYIYSEDKRPCDESGFPVREQLYEAMDADGIVKVYVPAMSVIFVTTLKI